MALAARGKLLEQRVKLLEEMLRTNDRQLELVNEERESRISMIRPSMIERMSVAPRCRCHIARMLADAELRQQEGMAPTPSDDLPEMRSPCDSDDDIPDLISDVE